MGEIGQFIVSLWFVPVILFVVLPLLVGCLWVLYRKLAVVTRVVGQEKKQLKMDHPTKKPL